MDERHGYGNERAGASRPRGPAGSADAGRAGVDGRSGRRDRLLDWGGLGLLLLFSVAAVAGYAVFGRDPSRLGGLSEMAARFYAVSFSFFAQAQVVLAASVLALQLVRRVGWRWVSGVVLIYLLSLGSELLGTAYGVPFGPYAYTSLLGAKWLGLVPVLIPLSWWFMAVPAHALAARALEWRAGGRRGGGVASRILLGSLLLLAWDLALDPAMSEVVRYWVWGERGPYYGMPLMNLVGWYVTGVALMGVLELVRARAWEAEVSTAWWASLYGANLILPLGMCVAAGFWGAVVATLAVLGGVVVWAWSGWGVRAGAWSPGAEVVG